MALITSSLPLAVFVESSMHFGSYNTLGGLFYVRSYNLAVYTGLFMVVICLAISHDLIYSLYIRDALAKYSTLGTIPLSRMDIHECCSIKAYSQKPLL